MTYEFKELSTYKKDNNLLELSIEALKVCIDDNTKFVKAGEHEITYSCTHSVTDTDFIHQISKDIIITKEYFEKHMHSYNVYITNESTDSDRWYLLSYCANDEAGNTIFINDNCYINFNADESYMSYSNDLDDFTLQRGELSLPFTKDMYFNLSMNVDFKVPFELLVQALEFKQPDGFNINLYNY